MSKDKAPDDPKLGLSNITRTVASIHTIRLTYPPKTNNTITDYRKLMSDSIFK